MKRFLLFLSLLVITLLRISAQDSTGRQALTMRHAFQLETKKAAISGIMITREDSTSILGSMVNEFGVSALDFIYTKRNGKVKLENIVGFLDKWYIRRVLKNDIKLCLQLLYGIRHKNSTHYNISVTPTETKIINKKRHITYTFSPLDYTTTGNETD